MHFGKRPAERTLTREQILVEGELTENLRCIQERPASGTADSGMPTIVGIRPRRPSGARRSVWDDSEESDL